MSVAIRAITRLQDADDINVTLGVGVDEYALCWDNNTARFMLRAMSAGVTDHGALTGLTDDDHTGYLLATGARTGASSQAQTFTNGIIGPSWKPASDGMTALKMQNAAGSADILTVDTTNKRVGINKTPDAARFEVKALGTDEQLMALYRPNGNACLVMFSDGSMYHSADPSTALSSPKSASGPAFAATQWDGAASVSRDQFYWTSTPYSDTDGHGALWLRNGSRGTIALGIAYGTFGQVAIGNYYPSAFTASAGKLHVVTTDANYPAATFQGAVSQVAPILQVLDSSSNGLFSVIPGGIVTAGIRPASDSTTALKVQNAAGTSDIITVDTTNKGVKIANPSGYLTFYDYGISGYYLVGGDANLVFSNSNNAARSYYFQGNVIDLSGMTYEYPAANLVWASIAMIGPVLNELRFAIGTGKNLSYQLDDATANAISTGVIWRAATSGTVANGFGMRQLWELESSTEQRSAAALDVAWVEKTDASRAARMTLIAFDANGAREGLRVEANGSASLVGLYGVTAIARPTTSHGTATFTANSGTAVNDASTFDGYTIKQAIKALRDIGILT